MLESVRQRPAGNPRPHAPAAGNDHDAAGAERLQIRIHGEATLPTLIHLPGLHGDWTLVSSFRAAMANQVRFVEMPYPRTLDWSLQAYAEAIRKALISHGIGRGWLLGESFGSQILWPMLAESGAGFTVEGAVLAGGFVRHPGDWGGRIAHAMSTRWPGWFLRGSLSAYAHYAAARHRRAPETLACLEEFIARRLEPLDRLAIRHRLGLIAESDPRPIASRIRLPVFALIGLVDPIVPALPVWLWLRRHCPGYRGARLIGRADHNVLGTAPKQSAEQILKWVRREA
jgi:pimeloyl-ACP methyl ester carboxylesterase